MSGLDRIRCSTRGTFVSPAGPGASPLERFLSYCRHDPLTGCVIWTGGRVRGRGKHGWYGCFRYEGRAWKAHRWAAKFIHGLVIDDMQIDHCCPPYRCGPKALLPDTMCVQHLQAITPAANRELQWLRVEVGLLDAPPLFEGVPTEAIPFYEPPLWLRPADYVRSAALADTPF